MTNTKTLKAFTLRKTEFASTTDGRCDTVTLPKGTIVHIVCSTDKGVIVNYGGRELSIRN